MKVVMGVLIVMVVAFALVSSGDAGWFSNANSGAVSGNVIAADNPGFPPYPCIASPAYTDYTDARAVSCDLDRATESRRTPDIMGSPGF